VSGRIPMAIGTDSPVATSASSGQAAKKISKKKNPDISFISVCKDTYKECKKKNPDISIRVFHAWKKS
jgi:hypothetical protein